jgi:hypothetical protein
MLATPKKGRYLSNFNTTKSSAAGERTRVALSATGMSDIPDVSFKNIAHGTKTQLAN